MAVWLQGATLVGEPVCVWMTDGLLWACACPVGGVRVTGKATGLEAWDGVMSAQHGGGGRKAVDSGWATLQTPDCVTAAPFPHPH